MNRSACLVGCCLALLPAACAEVQSADWPQWLGPRRDSVWREEGIISEIPASGLPVLWRTPVALGYSGPAVAKGRVYVMDYVRSSGDLSNSFSARNRLEGRERLLCLDARSGAVIWKHEYDCTYNISYPAGPRATPAVADGKVYGLGAEGNLFCLDARDGAVIWSKELKKEYRVNSPFWGFAAHPLVDGERLYCIVGGEGSVAVAFHKDTGKELWRSVTTSGEPGYCPPTLIHFDGRPQLLIWDPKKLHSLDPETGKIYWSQPLQPQYEMSITAPRLAGDHLYVSGIGNAGALFRLSRGTPAAEVVWRGTPRTGVYCANSTPIIDRGVIYGVSCQTGSMRAVRLENGERLWETFQPTTGGSRRASHGTAFIVRHKDRYFLFNERGDLVLARLSPDGYEEQGRFHVLEPTGECFDRAVVWSHPAFADRCLFARNDKEIVCVSLAE